MSKADFISILLIAAAVLPVGCGAPSENRRPVPQQYYYDDYQGWNGPGWYYGVYYSNEWGYRNWRRRHGHGRNEWRGHRGYYDGGHYRRGGGHR